MVTKGQHTLGTIQLKEIIKKSDKICWIQENVKSASKFISFVLGLLKIDRRGMYSVL